MFNGIGPTPWIIALILALIFFQGALGNKRAAKDSPSAEGTKLGIVLMYICVIAAAGFVLFTVVLAK